jgi:hypothetical protein
MERRMEKSPLLLILNSITILDGKDKNEQEK